MKSTALILGGGFGGFVAASEIRDGLPDAHRVTLVDRNAASTLGLSLLWLMTGERSPHGISRPLSRLMRKGIDFVRGEVERIDPARREVIVDGVTLIADRLVVALGADLAPEAIPGLARSGHNFYTAAGAASFRDELDRFRGGRIIVLTAAPAYKCPAAPYEAAMLVEDRIRRRGLRDRTRIDVIAAEPAPMGVAGPAVSQAVRGMLESKGIGYHPGRQIASADPVRRLLVFADGAEAGYDLLAYVPPHAAPEAVRNSPLAGDSGWVPVDARTMATRFDGVYAIGDVVSIPLAIGKPLPKAGTFAEGQARVAARNVVRDITGRGEPASFDGRGTCHVETGDGLAAYGQGDFYALPEPAVTLHPPSREWHEAKLRLERDWLEAGIPLPEDTRRIA